MRSLLLLEAVELMGTAQELPHLLDLWMRSVTETEKQLAYYFGASCFWLLNPCVTFETKGADLAEADWCREGVYSLTGFDLTGASSGIKSIWRYHKHWMETGKPPLLKLDNTNQSDEQLKKKAAQLLEQILEKAADQEPVRISTPYQRSH